MQLIGSPPHTWRIRTKAETKISKKGITSTYVENTKSTRPQNNFYKDHLHIRGEYLILALFLCHQSGSPPHTWRIHLIVVELRVNYWITSTYVENTLDLVQYSSCLKDHLHIRGEYHGYQAR